MTTQVDDVFSFQGKKYSVVQVGDVPLARIKEQKALFKISDFGISPSMGSTACYCGYQSFFSVDKSYLILSALHVFLEQEEPIINGVKPIPFPKSNPGGNWGGFNNCYENLDYRLEYTGKVLLGTGFIRDFYIGRDKVPAWKYDTVIELIFDKGVLQEEYDRSDEMLKIRVEKRAQVRQRKEAKAPPIILDEPLWMVPKKHRTQELCFAAVQQNGDALLFVPDELKTQEFCRMAVHQDGSLLGLVPDELKTPELYLDAVQSDGWVFKFVPEELKTLEFCLAAVQRNGGALASVPEEFKTHRNFVLQLFRKMARHLGLFPKS